MKRMRASVLLLMMAMAGLSLGQGAPPAQPARGPQMAVVNVLDVFMNLMERSELESSVEQTDKANKEANRAAQEELEKMARGVSAFKVGTTEYKQAQEALLRRSMEVKNMNDYNTQKLLLDLRVGYAGIFRKINESIGEYAQANNIVLVLQTEELKLDGPREPEQILQTVANHKVIYFSPAFDITGAIKTKMNTDFQLKKPQGTR